MEFLRTLALRHALVAVLALVLTLSGLGLGLAGASDRAMQSVTIAGLAVPICHVGRRDSPGPASPDTPVHDECCDQCALLAPMVLPTPPIPVRRVPVAAATARHAAVPAPPRLVRLRVPQQSQAPPTA